jgi:hypothetical protein
VRRRASEVGCGRGRRDVYAEEAVTLSPRRVGVVQPFRARTPRGSTPGENGKPTNASADNDASVLPTTNARPRSGARSADCPKAGEQRRAERRDERVLTSKRSSSADSTDDCVGARWRTPQEGQLSAAAETTSPQSLHSFSSGGGGPGRVLAGVRRRGGTSSTRRQSPSVGKPRDTDGRPSYRVRNAAPSRYA